jgi:ABC-2 type transport system ATP-binding protein
LTTYDLSDVQKLCNRVVLIDHDKLLYDGKLDLLQERFGGKRHLIVDFADLYDPIEVEDAQIVERQCSRVIFQFQSQEITTSELIHQISSSYRIRDLEVREPDIETTIRRIYEDHLPE